MNEFVRFQKIARLSRDVIVTEKIDGTNAQVLICGSEDRPDSGYALAELPDEESLYLYAGSRARYLSPTDDNYGFAKWVQAHADELWALGPGRHFGEWWGSGIQRGYGLTEKRFSLFNVGRWNNVTPAPTCCHAVPVLYRGPFVTDAIDIEIDRLSQKGSAAAPGFMKPEGIVVFHAASGTLFKKTLEKDEAPKGQPPADTKL